MKVFWGKEYPPEAEFQAFGMSLDKIETVTHLPSSVKAKGVQKRWTPDRNKWIHLAQKAIQAIQRQELEKVVLSCKLEIELFETVDPFALVAGLPATGAVCFCFAQKDFAFLGATPERLFSRTGRFLECDCMAGTKWKSSFSDKEVQELLPVKQFFSSVLTPLCVKPVSFSLIQSHKAGHLEHLHSVCRGQLKEDVEDKNLISLLHPTPALAGWPQKKALSLIRTLEPFSRDLYTSIIGWKTKFTSEYRVAIRCCVLTEKKATLYAGAGLVADSDPETEWEEIQQKFKLYESVFT